MLFLVAFLCIFAASGKPLLASSGAAPAPWPHWRGPEEGEKGTVIVVDPFCRYLGRRIAREALDRGYAVCEVISEPTLMHVEGEDEDLSGFGAPAIGEEHRWAEGLPKPLVGVLCESDAGLETAERLRAELCGGSSSSARRHKYWMNEALRKAGMATAAQILTGKEEEALEWLSERGNCRAIVKPYRGCSSSSVYLCDTTVEVQHAFRSVLGLPLYGSPGELASEVLVQEVLEDVLLPELLKRLASLNSSTILDQGTEWVIDSVSRAGKHKIMALWHYDKRAVNGAPFVYFATVLSECETEEQRQVLDYAVKALDALGVEVNCRWHLTDFLPMCDECIGYNSVLGCVDALCDPEAFDAYPDVPGPLLGQARVCHLVCHVSGELLEVDHLEEIQEMESVESYDIYPRFNIGEMVRPTIDIDSDAGWVRQVHADPEVVKRDYERLVELQRTMFRVRED